MGFIRIDNNGYCFLKNRLINKRFFVLIEQLNVKKQVQTILVNVFISVEKISK